MTAKMIAGAVGLAANQGDPSKIADRRRQFLRLGFEVVLGKEPLGVADFPGTVFDPANSI